MRMKGRKETAILGGGLAGLSTAYFMKDRCVVLEENSELGGLCRSFEKDGFVYDIGGHILFSKNKKILLEMVSWLRNNVHRKYRRNQIWYKDRFVKYPFENGLYSLDKKEIFDCLIGYLINENKEPKNLKEWCKYTFGNGIAEKYLLPYNEKIWKHDLEDMSTHWVERIPKPPMKDIIKSAIGIRTEGYRHQLYFYYPKKGGINSFICSLVGKIKKIEKGFKVIGIKKKNNKWIVSNGSKTVECDRIISTIPIFDLIGCLDSIPGEVKRALGKLIYNSLILVMIGVKSEVLNNKTAIYIPDPEILPHRVCYMKYFSSTNAPQGCSHLIAEITVKSNDALLKMNDNALVEKVSSQLKDICGFSKTEIISTDVRKIRYAYVIYDRDYLKNTRIVFSYLNSLGIHCTGRFGTFQYINMDTCVEMSKRLVASLNSEI
jgi:protoporphyrinogen oxidase